MLRWTLACAVMAAFAAAAPANSEELQEEKPHDAGVPKETNYQKYIGTQEFRLPFKTRVVVPFSKGQTIHAVGTLKKEPHRVDFNFHKGASKDADLPLHFSIRFDEGFFAGGKFVYNTFMDGNWTDSEQRISNPFKAGEEFDLRVRIEENHYRVFANRKDVGKFEIRQTLDGIDHSSIKGDLSALNLFHYGGSFFPAQYTAIANLVPGKRLDISGVPTGKRFNINLYRENKEYALQVSVRFNEGAIVRNSMQNNMWGKEEREGGMPLVKGDVFDVTIINEEFSFQLFFNGLRYATFAHRGAPNDVKTLEVDGDVELHTVTINDALGQ